MILFNVNKSAVAAPIDSVMIGKIGKAYGVLGWIRVISFTDESDSIFSYTPWFICFQSVWKLIYLDKWRFLGNNYVVKIQGISNREIAKLLTSCFICIEVKQLPCLQHDEYYCRDLIGCVVMDIDGECLGSVCKIIETTANDVLVIKIDKRHSVDTKKECLIPFIQDEVIKTVNIRDRIIIVDWDINF